MSVFGGVGCCKSLIARVDSVATVLPLAFFWCSQFSVRPVLILDSELGMHSLDLFAVVGLGWTYNHASTPLTQIDPHLDLIHHRASTSSISKGVTNKTGSIQRKFCLFSFVFLPLRWVAYWGNIVLVYFQSAPTIICLQFMSSAWS